MIGYIALAASAIAITLSMYSRYLQNKELDNLAKQIKYVEWITCRRIEAMTEDTKKFMADGQTQMIGNAFTIAERAAAHAIANPSRDDATRLETIRRLRLVQKLQEPPTTP
jgi:hypothetical protein